jgi:predicted nucleic acid binding AN1-type Zn finger protein
MKCYHKECNNKSLKYIGLCLKCNNNYCHTHRYPEIHFCIKLNEILNNEREILKNKLYKESVKDKHKKLINGF